jgi:hypothetical protein
MCNYFNSTTQQMMGVKLIKCHYPLLNLLTTSSTLNLVEKIMQFKERFDQLQKL